MLEPRPSFPKATEPEAPEQKRKRYETWIIHTHNDQLARAKEASDDDYLGATRMTDPEYRAVMAQPNHDPVATRASLTLAVAARCWQCVSGDDPEADELKGWSRVTNCKTSKCPLHSVRPYQSTEDKIPRMSRRDASFEGVSVYDHAAKALANPGSRPLAVKGYCHQCCGGSSGVAVMREVDGCVVANCALWMVRPTLREKQTADVPVESNPSAI